MLHAPNISAFQWLSTALCNLIICHPTSYAMCHHQCTVVPTVSFSHNYKPLVSAGHHRYPVVPTISIGLSKSPWVACSLYRSHQSPVVHAVSVSPNRTRLVSVSLSRSPLVSSGPLTTSLLRYVTTGLRSLQQSHHLSPVFHTVSWQVIASL